MSRVPSGDAYYREINDGLRYYGGREMAAKKTLGVAVLTILLGTAALGSLKWLVPAAGAAPRDTSSPSSCPQIIGDQFYVNDQRYLIKGLNYYEKDHAWDEFWPYWHNKANRATVAHELDLARALGVNTLRIFLRWDFFTTSPDDPTVPLEAKQDLDEFLELAAAKQMRVLLTLFDGMPNEGTESRYIDPAIGSAHVNSLLTPFKNRAGGAVDFSQDGRILAWDIKNEPDRDYYKDADGDGVAGVDLVSALPGDVAAVQSWADEIIRRLGQEDARQPVTVGVYGAVMSGTTLVYSPTLVSYYTNVITDPVDFLSIHYSLDEKNFPADVNAVEAIAGGKPIVVEEFALHTWAEHPIDPHNERDQAAYYNAILSTSEADHLAGAMFWTLTDFSQIEGSDERLKHVGILRNDYSEKPAAAVIREHFKPFVAYLDTFDGYALITNNNCDPPLGWVDNRAENGTAIITCDPAVHGFAPSQNGQARLTKLGGPDGVVASPVLEAVNVDFSPQLIVDILTYTVRDSGNNSGPINLDIGVKPIDQGTPTWLATDLVDVSVDAAGLELPRTVYAALPSEWPAEQDFQIIFRLQDQVPGNTGYSAGFELGFAEIGTCPSAPPPSVKLEGSVQKLFRDDFNGRAIDTLQWNVVHGAPLLLNCSAVLTTTRLPGVPSKTELSSHRLFEPKSMLVISATTQNWQGDNKEGDTSFGFEGWNANCHSAVIVTSNGQLALIRPDEEADCNQPDPPTRECYQPIQDWETLRTQPREFAILWTSTRATLSIDGVPKATWDDQASTGCTTPAIPQVPLPVRLNANVFNEDRDRLPGEENHYDQDVLWVDYVYIPEGIALPIILKNAVISP
jgi:hypothetical protein